MGRKSGGRCGKKTPLIVLHFVDLDFPHWIYFRYRHRLISPNFPRPCSRRPRSGIQAAFPHLFGWISPLLPSFAARAPTPAVVVRRVSVCERAFYACPRFVREFLRTLPPALSIFVRDTADDDYHQEVCHVFILCQWCNGEMWCCCCRRRDSARNQVIGGGPTHCRGGGARSALFSIFNEFERLKRANRSVSINNTTPGDFPVGLFRCVYGSWPGVESAGRVHLHVKWN